MGYDDSTGKNKFADSKARNKSIISFFVVGLCIGLVIAERVYISKGGKVPVPHFLQTHHDRFLMARSGSLQSASEKNSLTSYPDSAPPRNELEKYLRQIAPQKEVLVALSTFNVNWDGMLDTFCSGIKRANIKNHLIMALDADTKDWALKNGFNAYQVEADYKKSPQHGTGDNHAVSAMKFGILRKVVELGWAVFLSDVDISILQNPFNFLYRDSDVEGMTDGFDTATAYGTIEGFDDPSMGWARFAQFEKHFNLNSGLFYLRANERTLNLLKRLEERLNKQKYWDQTAYNEEIFFPSHGDYKSPQVSVRVMDIDKFMNSKRLFKIVRNLPKAEQPPMPVTVHINYHPDKHARMKAVFKYYLDNDPNALASFPGGSEPGSK